MQLNKKSMVERVAGTDTTRPFLTHAYLDVDAKVLVATDGHLMIKHPVVVDEGDVSAFVSVTAIKAARKLAPMNGVLQIAVGAEHLGLTDGTTMPTPKCKQPFPPYDKVIPNYAAVGTMSVRLNVAMLMGLLQALGGDTRNANVALTFPIPTGDNPMLEPILVKTDTSDAVGIMMPYRPGKSGTHG